LKLLVIAVGHRMPDWVDTGFSEYARRMPREAQLKLIEVKAEIRGDATSVARALESERRRIDAAMPRGSLKIALDERGRSYTTRELVECLKGWQMAGRDVAFVIGGADGLPEAIRQEAESVWSLSPLTLPHGLVRIVVAEQLYRAHSILKNHPYHRD
jgi:23S rRNA (pseudouridine1915-N3)-methyltransferase